MDSLKKQVGGSHYKKYEYEPVQLFLDTGLNYCLANAIKYLTRIGVDKDKGSLGIKKSVHYLQMYKEYLEDNIVTGLNEGHLKYTETFLKQFESNPPVKECIEAILELAFNTDKEIFPVILKLEQLGAVA